MERHLRRQGRGGVGRASSTAWRCSTSTTPRISRADVDFNVVGTDAGAYVELQGTAEGKPFDRAAADGAARPRRRGPRHACSRRRPRCSPPSGGEPASASLVATRSTPQAARAARAAARSRTRELVSLDDLGIEGDPVEDGETFETNAAIKARFGLRASGLPTLADDSGIEVDALGGAPGVRTRRYAGEDATDDENNAKLLAALAGLPPERRGARYVCVLALALPGDAGRAAA